ncbi:dTDP-4-dehydrorhamnose reductase [Thiomicrospira sp. R3]|uniref:dTDP-4-dehydrorhamnose reductase n=1 Tax=Thiomicrospira sp. R3 TaxID=3035472 RepID=UPI00259B25BB|nr:dTDP-4-dehydrorhamnose reductase [Thiomicrospira sp. R3]WFE68852.1 dTDP-4-dehydrorhamnose reductase [Thiomicrospira sp. R3]
MLNKLQILVTGKSGQLGQSLKKILDDDTRFDFTFVGRDALDLSNPQSIETYFSDQRFDVIINCAAYTAVDKAESEPELADQVNHLAVKQLADIAKAQHSHLVHISTDYVFDGCSHRPYLETDATAPQGVYGMTKWLGEQAVISSGCQATIIRTSWVYSEFGNNFVKTMLRLGKERDQLGVIFDQVGSPTYASDLAQAVLSLACHSDEGRNLTTPKMPDQVRHGAEVNIYHYSNEGVCSWYDFAKAIFELSDVKCQIIPVETQYYPTAAKRPHYSLLNKAKIKQDYNFAIPYWRNSLRQCLCDLVV